MTNFSYPSEEIEDLYPKRSPYPSNPTTLFTTSGIILKHPETHEIIEVPKVKGKKEEPERKYHHDEWKEKKKPWWRFW